MKLSRDAYYLAVIIILLSLLGQILYSYKYLPAKTREVKVFYNRDIEANKKIIEEVQNADKYVYFAIYTFTRLDIKDALLGAKHRGLEVKGLTDAGQVKKIELQTKIISELREAGIPVAEQDHLGIMHLKTLVTDKSYVSGSYNWTASATNVNDEILEIGYDPELRQKYEDVLLKILGKYK